MTEEKDIKGLEHKGMQLRNELRNNGTQPKEALMSLLGIQNGEFSEIVVAANSIKHKANEFVVWDKEGYRLGNVNDFARTINHLVLCRAGTSEAVTKQIVGASKFCNPKKLANALEAETGLSSKQLVSKQKQFESPFPKEWAELFLEAGG